ncbi:2-amino-3-carboxymuconate-6-semialdehyde decarboxylase [Delphinella strobiligena]|nr:2-amino-3-carboxymuconate-6-semialdehyde decarboxylase [Delphinella strobiligena]
MTPPLVTLEEHYVSDYVRSMSKDSYKSFPPAILEKLESLGEQRLKDMDAGGVNLQITSHGPLDADINACRHANDELATACNQSKGRLGGFAMLPMVDPTAAADELSRCVKEHSFVGALINNHLKGDFYDDSKFWPVFARAEELDVPIYIHPTFAADEWMPHYKGNFPDKAAFSMSIAGWGWHSETALHVLKLWASGLFDKHPKLKIIIGHMGEMLPFQLDRIFPMSAMWAEHQRDLKTVWNENFWITTSGMFSLAPMSCLLKMCKIDRILYSVDYPFSTNEKGLAYDLTAICSGNAEKLLRIKMQ